MHRELFLLVLWWYVDLCQVLSSKICYKFWFCKFVTNHVVNQSWWKLLSVSQSTSQYRNTKLPCVQTVVYLHDQLWIAQIFWWILYEFLIRNPFLIKLCQNIVTFLFFLQWTFAQWNVEQRLLRRLLAFVNLLFDFLQRRGVRFLTRLDILINFVEEDFLIRLLWVRVFLLKKPGKLPEGFGYLLVFIVFRLLFFFSDTDIFSYDFAPGFWALRYVIIWEVWWVWKDVSFLIFLV